MPSEERSVEKLERVLAAEDAARTALADARTEAAAIRAAGVEDARSIETEAVDASRRAVAAESEAALAKAHADADALTRQAAKRAEKTLAEARGRLDDTVLTISASLQG
jgi:vacuolar-type H+-ATPase subunit H